MTMQAEEKERVVCRYCGEQWKGHEVVCVREPDNGDPGRWEGKTLCCGRFICEQPDTFLKRGTKPPEYAAITQTERAWLAHYGLTGASHAG